MSEAGSDTSPAIADSESESDASVRRRDSQPAASDSSRQPRDPSRDPAGLAGRRPAQQRVKSMPLWREATWGSERVNARTQGSPTGVAADDGSSANGASSSNGAAAERSPWRRPSNGEDPRGARPGVPRDPLVRRAGQNGASSQAAWESSASPRRGAGAFRPDVMPAEPGIARRQWAEQPRQKPALGELAAADRTSNGGRSPSSSSASEPGQDSPRQQQQQQQPQVRQRRQYGADDRAAAPEQRRPARRNPGIPWEANIMGSKGVPLLFVLPEDEQQGADGTTWRPPATNVLASRDQPGDAVLAAAHGRPTLLARLACVVVQQLVRREPLSSERFCGCSLGQPEGLAATWIQTGSKPPAAGGSVSR